MTVLVSINIIELTRFYVQFLSRGGEGEKVYISDVIIVILRLVEPRHNDIERDQEV